MRQSITQEELRLLSLVFDLKFDIVVHFHCVFVDESSGIDCAVFQRF